MGLSTPTLALKDNGRMSPLWSSPPARGWASTVIDSSVDKQPSDLVQTYTRSFPMILQQRTNEWMNEWHRACSDQAQFHPSSRSSFVSRHKTCHSSYDSSYISGCFVWHGVIAHYVMFQVTEPLMQICPVPGWSLHPAQVLPQCHTCYTEEYITDAQFQSPGHNLSWNTRKNGYGLYLPKTVLEDVCTQHCNQTTLSQNPNDKYTQNRWTCLFLNRGSPTPAQSGKIPQHFGYASSFLVLVSYKGAQLVKNGVMRLEVGLSDT